jgi:hypothetical protein
VENAEQLSSTQMIASETDLRPVKVWSPLTVGIFGLVLAYPCSFVLAVKNWRALGQRQRIASHATWALILTVLLSACLLLTPRAARWIALATNIFTFSYIRERLRSDIAEFSSTNASAAVTYRPWYSAIGWALVGIFWFLLFFVAFCAIAEYVFPSLEEV